MKSFFKNTCDLIIAATIIPICFYACATQPRQADTYNMFRGGPKHAGIYPSVEVSASPHVKWKFKTNGVVNSSPAIDGDKIYFGSGDSTFYCLDIKTGLVAWQFKTGGEVNSSPAIVNGVVFFGSADGNFYALNENSGQVKWQFKTAGEKRFSAKHLHGQLPANSVFTDRWDFLLSSPVTDDHKVYFGSGSGYFYALDIATGKQVWAFKTSGIIHSSPAIAFGNVYFGGWDTYMHAVNTTTGKEVWKFATGIDTVIHNQTGITSSPIIADSMLYFGCRDSYVYALNAITGKLTWKKYNDQGWISLTPVVFGDKLIYSSGSSEKFVALNKKTGKSIYETNFGTATFASPSVAGSTVYQGTFTGTMVAVDANTGKTKWTFATDACKQDTHEILNPDYSINNDKLMAAVNKTAGKLRPLDFALEMGFIISSPVIKDGVMYFGSSDGNLYAVE